MAATIQIFRLSGSVGGGASPDYTEKTSASIRASTSDVPTPGTTNPIPIPVSGGGSNHSFAVTNVLYAACPPDNSITNIKWFTDGTNSFGTGIECLVATASAYNQAGGTAGSSGELLNITNNVAVQDAACDAFQYTTAAASVLAIGGSIAATTGCIADEFLLWQLNCASTAGAGNVTEETFSFRFDEA